MPHAKAQASLELLLVLAAFISVLALILPRVESVREGVLASVQAGEEQAELARIAHAAAEAYLLGDGNVRELRMHALAGKTLSISDGMISAAGSAGGVNFTESGAFCARRCALALPASGGRVLVSCCSPQGVEFTASTATP